MTTILNLTHNSQIGRRQLIQMLGSQRSWTSNDNDNNNNNNNNNENSNSNHKNEFNMDIMYHVDKESSTLCNRSNKMSLTIETAIDNLAKVEHCKAMLLLIVTMQQINVIYRTNNSGIGIDFSMVLVKHNTARNEDLKLAQTKNSFDVTLLCMTGVYPFTLFEKATKLLDMICDVT